LLEGEIDTDDTDDIYFETKQKKKRKINKAEVVCEMKKKQTIPLSKTSNVYSDSYLLKENRSQINIDDSPLPDYSSSSSIETVKFGESKTSNINTSNVYSDSYLLKENRSQINIDGFSLSDHSPPSIETMITKWITDTSNVCSNSYLLEENPALPNHSSSPSIEMVESSELQISWLNEDENESKFYLDDLCFEKNEDNRLLEYKFVCSEKISPFSFMF
jgi:hypothetical protein